MATSKESSTPRKVYVNKNNCVLCGFSFIQTEVSGTGEETVKKFLKLKLRLNAERIETIESVIDNFRPTDEEKELHGVCIKCFRKVESCIRVKKEHLKLKEELESSRERVVGMSLLLPALSPRRIVREKRQLRSPLSIPPAKQVKDFPSNFYVMKLTNVPALESIVAETTGCLYPKPPQPQAPMVVKGEGFFCFFLILNKYIGCKSSV